MDICARKRDEIEGDVRSSSHGGGPNLPLKGMHSANVRSIKGYAASELISLVNGELCRYSLVTAVPPVQLCIIAFTS